MVRCQRLSRPAGNRRHAGSAAIARCSTWRRPYSPRKAMPAPARATSPSGSACGKRASITISRPRRPRSPRSANAASRISSRICRPSSPTPSAPAKSCAPRLRTTSPRSAATPTPTTSACSFAIATNCRTGRGRRSLRSRTATRT